MEKSWLTKKRESRESAVQDSKKKKEQEEAAQFAAEMEQEEESRPDIALDQSFVFQSPKFRFVISLKATQISRNFRFAIPCAGPRRKQILSEYAITGPPGPKFRETFSRNTTFGVGCTLSTAGRHLNCAKVLRCETANERRNFRETRHESRKCRTHPNFAKNSWTRERTQISKNISRNSGPG